MPFVRLPLIVFVLALGLAGDDPYCPAYPQADRMADQAKLRLERSTWRSELNVETPPAINIIDEFIFGKMVQDGVQPAPLTNDPEFQRL